MENISQMIVTLEEIEKTMKIHLLAIERVFENSGGLADVVDGMDISLDKLQQVIKNLKIMAAKEALGNLFA